MIARIFDALVVGCGIAGLRAALAMAAGSARVAVLTKDGPTDSSTEQAQGGIAAALSDDDEVALHYQDTLLAGDGLCNEAAARVLVEEGPRRALELIEWGARFDREGARLALAREGAHSKSRILRAQGDSTGREIVRALVAAVRRLDRVTLVSHTFSVDPILQGGRCVGLLALDERSLERVTFLARAVVLATGGAGQVYRETTNPPQATGDGIAMAYRAGAEVMDLEFVQFHPTALCLPGVPRFLLSEAMRGEGGRLINEAGEPFMTAADPRGDLAPRDVVSRAIVAEMRRTSAGCVYLDMRHLGAAFVQGRFPRIAETCARHGVDIARDRIPVTPCAHYVMGGVKTDLWGRTSIPGLYAAGEVACTGVHGANRLASNSLLEGLVFGARAGEAVLADGGPFPPADPGLTGTDAIRAVPAPRVAGTLSALRAVMWEHVGILRDAAGLGQAIVATLDLERALAPGSVTRAGLETRNQLFVGRLIAESALRRQESRGAHFRTDHPEKDPGRGRHSIIAPGAPAPDLPCVPLPEIP